MGRVIVEVMPKPEILDPQGKAIGNSLKHLNLGEFDVRQGKRFELTVPGEVTPEILQQVQKAAAEVLANPVIEDVVAVRAAHPAESEVAQ